MTLAPGTIIDERYVVTSVLGRGGMGCVYVAQDKWLKRSVALKMLDPLFGGSDPVERLRGEAASLAAIRSENVVQIYAFGIHEAACYFAMELVRGSSLEDVIHDYKRRGAAVPLFRAITVLTSVASGLARVHKAGVVHRDVKPANIVIEEDSGRPVLIDFGLAVPSEPADDARTAFGGTPSYMAPEQCVGSADCSAQTDVYALGCTAFELLTGRVPFTGERVADVLVAHCTTPVPAVSSVAADLDMFDAAIARALAKDPAERYRSVDQFAVALEDARSVWRSRRAPSVRVLAVEAAPESADSASDTAPNSGPPINVLVVDDDDEFRKFAGRAAQLGMYRSRITLRLASSGAAALAAAEREMPHLVLLDYDMPHLNGVETLSQLRARPDGGRARVVVISARTGDEQNGAFAMLGVRDFLVKPVQLKDLVEKVADIARRSGWVDDQRSSTER